MSFVRVNKRRYGVDWDVDGPRWRAAVPRCPHCYWRLELEGSLPWEATEEGPVVVCPCGEGRWPIEAHHAA